MRFVVLSLFAFACATDTGIVGDADAGETLFADNCAACHGADGTGGSGPDITGLDATTVEDTVIAGEGDMPAYGETFDEQEIADVVAYVLTL